MQNKANIKVSARDLCQTPPYALQPLLPYLQKDWVVWECAAGESYLAKELWKNDYEVIATDILDGVDFLTNEVPRFDVIVTNPPFSLKYDFIERCYELKKPWALLMPLETLGAARAQRLFAKHDMQLICVSPRIDFKMPNKGWSGKGSHFPTAWFTHGLGIDSDLIYADISAAKKQWRQSIKSQT